MRWNREMSTTVKSQKIVLKIRMKLNRMTSNNWGNEYWKICSSANKFPYNSTDSWHRYSTGINSRRIWRSRRQLTEENQWPGPHQWEIDEYDGVLYEALVVSQITLLPAYCFRVQNRPCFSNISSSTANVVKLPLNLWEDQTTVFELLILNVRMPNFVGLENNSRTQVAKLRIFEQSFETIR